MLDWKAIQSEVPGIAIRSVTAIGEGWSAVAYRVNDDLVFKFPKRRSVWDELERERAFLDYARRGLPIPVTEHLHAVRDSAGAPHGYVVLRAIPGDAIQPRNAAAAVRDALPALVGGFLRALHDLDATPVAHILPREDARTNVLQYQRDADESIAPRLSVAERRRLSDTIARHLDDAGNFEVDPRILHADLSAEHILSDGRAVTGVIDWGDVSIGDPDYDFSYLYDDFGAGFVRETARRYGHPDPDRLIRKARFYSIVDQIGTIVYSAGEALAGDIDGSWVRLRELLAEG